MPGSFSQAVTAQALLIVCRRLSLQLFMGIVTGGASQARVTLLSPALAGYQAVGRGPCCGDTFYSG